MEFGCLHVAKSRKAALKIPYTQPKTNKKPKSAGRGKTLKRNLKGPCDLNSKGLRSGGKRTTAETEQAAAV